MWKVNRSINIATENNLSITDRLQLFQLVCAAISYAHRNLVVHRDIKPSNILVTSEGVPKLLDFGIAKILQSDSGEKATASGIHFMTPEYASPEQAKGLQVTTLSDVYALGDFDVRTINRTFPYPLANRSAIEILRIITETQPQLPSAIIETTEQDNTTSVTKTREGSIDRLKRRLRGDLDNIILMALRKEPERRYQSVDHLSEDIRRHLQGLPISARKDTIAYRTARFVLRNRIAVSISVLALLTMAFLGSFMQWRANKQAKLFQEFGQEVTRIEASMRYAYLLPLHNIERDKKQVTDRLSSIKKRMEEMGSVSYGPGYYSLGRGYLSLHRYQDAYDTLILAWQKYGYQQPAAANALGLSLALLYQEKLREAEQLYDREQLSKRKLELEKELGVPAKKFIQHGATASEAPEYIVALLALLDKKYLDALNKARVAEQMFSWHYESKTLQGDIYAAMGTEQYFAGNMPAATELYEKAKIAYLEAAKKGQSDPQIYDALCSVQSYLQEIQIENKRKSSEETLDETVDYCSKALKVDSQNINANLIASKVYKNWAYHQVEHGDDPTVAVEKSAGFAHAALKIDSENAFAHIALGEVYSTRSNWELIRGQDPVPFLEIADASFTKASQKMPEDYQIFFLQANNSIKRATYNIDKGKDPRPALEKTIELTRKAIKLNPPHVFKNYTMLGHAYHVKGQYEQDIGLDPTASLNESIQQLKQSISINPEYLVPYVWCGNSYLTLAEYHISKEENANPALDEAVKIFRKIITLDPENVWSYSGIGIAESKRATVLQKEEKDPSAALQTSREAFEKALQLETSLLYIYYFFADAELIGARDAISHGKSPEPFIKESERIVQKCLKVNPDCQECLEPLTAIYLLRAEQYVASGRSAEHEISSGIEFADKTLKINSSAAFAMAYRGKLFLLRAKTTTGLQRKENAKEAEASLTRAFDLKSFLRREYGKDFEEAKRLAQN